MHVVFLNIYDISLVFPMSCFSKAEMFCLIGTCRTGLDQGATADLVTREEGGRWRYISLLALRIGTPELVRMSYIKQVFCFIKK